jgi:hypothetical protein
VTDDTAVTVVARVIVTVVTRVIVTVVVARVIATTMPGHMTVIANPAEQNTRAQNQGPTGVTADVPEANNNHGLVICPQN